MKSTKVRTLGVYCVALQGHASCKKVWHMHARFFGITKNGWLRIAVQCVKCWISAMKQFQRNPHKYFDLRCLLSTWHRSQDEQTLQRWDVTWQTDRQTHRPNYNPHCAWAPRVNYIYLACINYRLFWGVWWMAIKQCSSRKSILTL